MKRYSVPLTRTLNYLGKFLPTHGWQASQWIGIVWGLYVCHLYVVGSRPTLHCRETATARTEIVSESESCFTVHPNVHPLLNPVYKTKPFWFSEAAQNSATYLFTVLLRSMRSAPESGGAFSNGVQTSDSIIMSLLARSPTCFQPVLGNIARSFVLLHVRERQLGVLDDAATVDLVFAIATSTTFSRHRIAVLRVSSCRSMVS
jgi:hypothetical protein